MQKQQQLYITPAATTTTTTTRNPSPNPNPVLSLFKQKFWTHRLQVHTTTTTTTTTTTCGRPSINSSGCQSLFSDIMHLSYTTDFYQVRTSGHQWNSF